MSSNRLTIEHREWVLDAGVDAEALQLEICEAMRKGGGIVSFEAGHRSMTTVISPGVAVFFERIEAVEPRDVAGSDDAARGFMLDDLEGY